MNNMSLSANKKYRIENNAPHYIGFFGKSSAFSNFHPVPLVYETKQLNSNCEAHKNITYYFKSSEHLYQWKKGMSNPRVNKCYSIADDEQSPPDGAICSSIRTAPTPSHAKYIARHKVKINFHTWSLPSRISIMREIVNLKFKHVSANAMPLNWNPDKVYTLKGKSYLSPSEQLLLTGNTILVETSPYCIDQKLLFAKTLPADTLRVMGSRSLENLKYLSKARFIAAPAPGIPRIDNKEEEKTHDIE